MKLYMSDLYRIEMHYPLDEVQNDILYFLYQPLIGSQALQVYMMLYTEGKRMQRFLKPSPLSRLLSFVSIDLMTLEKQLRILEAIGLLKRYVYYDEMTHYVFVMQSPLSLKAFFKNQILASLFQSSMSQEDYVKTISYFKVNVEHIDQYEDVTASFTDVFEVQHHQKKPLKLKEEVFNKQSKDVRMPYDTVYLKQCLLDYQISKQSLTKDDLDFITQLGAVYSVDALTLASFVKESLTSKQLDRALLKKKIKDYCDIQSISQLKEVYHKQPLQYTGDYHTQDPLHLHMQYLEQMTPYELLKQKQGGSEPVYHDLMIVETLMVQLKLKPAVVNVLIEYVLGKNKNRLSKRYCEAIGSSWARKHIETAMDAYHELMQDSVEEEKTISTEREEDVKELNQSEMQALLQELREGQL